MDVADLKKMLQKIDGRGYKAYRQLKGSYSFPRFTLFIDYVQGDPFATPSRLRARVSQSEARIPPPLYEGRTRRTACEDFLARTFASLIVRQVKGRRGTGKSGLIAVDSGGQEILERTAAVVNEDFVEVRFQAGLPAAGRRCLGGEAIEMLAGELPALVDGSLFYGALDAGALQSHVESAEDQDWLRDQLSKRALVAFVGDGSLLPRASGVSDLPLKEGEVIPFRSPEGLKVDFSTPNGGAVSGMGVPEGVTLVVGGGFHGKSTLLGALERGVYNHIPGDGRELVVTREDAVKVRAEDGRRVEKVDISPFIDNLPLGRGTRAFCTENASGSTSQAANIIEAMEVGCRLLLIDEDTSATNFMIRDELMQKLIASEREPITPFIDQVHNLFRDHGVSTVLVMGGSGDYFEVADNVIAMDDYAPRVVTARAGEIIAARKDRREHEGGDSFGPLVPRAPEPRGIDPRRGRKEKVAVRGLSSLEFGRQSIDLSQVEQLVDISQTRSIGEMIRHARRSGIIDGRTSLDQVVTAVLAEIRQGGLGRISPYVTAENNEAIHPGDFALPRKYEVAAAFNRLRSLAVNQLPPASTQGGS